MPSRQSAPSFLSNVPFRERTLAGLHLPFGIKQQLQVTHCGTRSPSPVGPARQCSTFQVRIVLGMHIPLSVQGLCTSGHELCLSRGLDTPGVSMGHRRVPSASKPAGSSTSMMPLLSSAWADGSSSGTCTCMESQCRNGVSGSTCSIWD
jgi:hypothetical protein